MSRSSQQSIAHIVKLKIHSMQSFKAAPVGFIYNQFVIIFHKQICIHILIYSIYIYIHSIHRHRYIHTQIYIQDILQHNMQVMMSLTSSDLSVLVLNILFFVLCYSCTLGLCQQLLIPTLSRTVHLLMTYNYRYLLFQTKYSS